MCCDWYLWYHISLIGVFWLAVLIWISHANFWTSHKRSSWYDDVIKWKRFPRYWPFGRGIHRSTVNSPHKGQWRGALMFSLICVWINDWVNNREAGDLRRYRVQYDVILMNQWPSVRRNHTQADAIKPIFSHNVCVFHSNTTSDAISRGIKMICVTRRMH